MTDITKSCHVRLASVQSLETGNLTISESLLILVVQ